MNKGYGEPSSAMRSRLASSRGPHRFLLLALCLVLAVVGLNYWRLVTTNSDLADRLHRMEELLDRENNERQTLDGQHQKCKSELLKAAAELHHLQVDLEDRVLKMKAQADQLADMADDTANCQKEAEQLKEKHEQELSEEAADRQTRLTEAEQRLETVQKELGATRRNLTTCSSQSCGDRVTQLQFDLDTCRFSQKHAGNPGILRLTGGDTRGPGQLPLLSPAAVAVQQTALRGMHYHGGPILLFDPADSYRPAPRLSVAAAAAGKAASRGTLDGLFESGDGAGPRHPESKSPADSQGNPDFLPANPSANSQVDAASGPTAAQSAPDDEGGSAGQLPAPAAADAAAPADGGDGAVNPAESPAPGEMLSAGGKVEPAAAAAAGKADAVPEVAPVEGEVAPAAEHGEDSGKAEEVAEEGRAAEEPGMEEPAAAEEVADEEEPAEEGGADQLKPAGHVVPGPADEGAAAGEPPADIDYRNNQIKEEAEDPDQPDGGADDADGAGDSPADTAQRQAEEAGTAVKEAALISGLQELSEKAARPDPPAGPDQQGADSATGDGDTLPEAKPAAGEQKMADFEDLDAA